MDLRLEDLLLFTRCVQEGSVSAAARALGITQAAGSRRLQRLETAVGGPVLHRTTRALRLTRAGQQLLPAAGAMLARAEAFERAVRGLSDQAVGAVTVSAPVLLGQRLGARLGALLAAEHPGLRLSLRLSNERVDLVRDGVDVALRVGGLPDSTRVARRLGEADLGLYGPAGQYAVSSPDELRALPWMGRSDPARLRATGPQGATWEAAVPLGFSCDDQAVLCDAVAAGLGVAVLPAFLGEPRAELERLLPRWVFGVVPVHAVWLPEARQDPRVRAVVAASAVWMAAQRGWRLEQADGDEP